MKRTISFIFLCNIVLLLNACGSAAPVPEDKFFRLDMTHITQQRNIFDGNVAVQRFKADGLHNGRAMLYTDSKQPLQLKQYHYHHWLDAPSLLIQEHLISYLRKTNAAPLVIEEQPGIQSDYLISGRIIAFEQVNDAKGVRADVKLELQVTKRGARMPILVKEYSQSIQTADTSLHTIASSLSTGLTNIYAKFLDDISERLKK